MNFRPRRAPGNLDKRPAPVQLLGDEAVLILLQICMRASVLAGVYKGKDEEMPWSCMVAPMREVQTRSTMGSP